MSNNGSRFRELFCCLSGNIGSSLAVACQDWANTKAAYRFLSNSRVSEREILSGHFESTRQRVAVASEPLLVHHDRAEFIFKRQEKDSIGLLKKLPFKDGRGRDVTTCGILMHSSLVVTSSGLPLGLGAIKFWTRDRFKGTNALKRHVNPTRIPIEKKESVRWLDNLRQATTLLESPGECVHIADRESDIYELFCLAEELGTRFLFRTCVGRVAGNGTMLLSNVIDELPVQGLHRLRVTDKHGDEREAVLEMKFTSLVVHPAEYKKRAYPELILTVIEARERKTPKNSEAIVWKLITNLPVSTLASAIEKLQWHAMRWKIETFHKILKSGCRAEESRLRTAERLVNLIAIFCILSWRVFWVTTLRRDMPEAEATLAFTEREIEILRQLAREKSRSPFPPCCSLAQYVLEVAKLGGYLARRLDPPPGNIVIWRGLSRLNDIQLGFSLQL